MDIEKAINYIETSFLKDLLFLEGITDISYNGEDIFYLSNRYGRNKSNIKVNNNEVKDFIRQIANISEKQFSYLSPNLDVSIGKYRLNATHQSVARRKNMETINFALRIAGKDNLINDNSGFLPSEIVSLFEVFLLEKVSIVIGGITGSGKTELQKYLIKKMTDNTRIIVIDNVLELANINDVDNLDINIWQADERNKETTMNSLIRNALRCNPDWLIAAESRGYEMIDVLNSAMTGHPIITTIHAFDIDSMPSRMARMVMMNDKKMDYQSVLEDIYHHFRLFIYLKSKKNKDGSIFRYVAEISYFNEKGSKKKIYENIDGIHVFNPIDHKFISYFSKESINKIPEVFKN